VNRIACSFAIVAVALAPAVRAWADDAPTKDQLDAAKQAFVEGKQLHDAGKVPEAIEKFKESYRLSKNPLLLYNIALTLDENKQTDSALFYYRKFLADAPADAAQRPPAEDRVKVLEDQKLADEMASKPDAGAATKGEPAVAKPAKASNFDITTFQHTVVDEAPPNKPLDISATVPENANVSVILYYRIAGSPEFTAKPMKWHGTDLVARIPAAKVTGTAIQYYIEVKDANGAKLTSSGKSTSPNLINLDASAQEKTFSDFVDDVPVKEPKHHDKEDPLHDDSAGSVDAKTTTEASTPPGDGLFDVGSTKFEYTKWGVTGGAVVLIGVGVLFDVMAGEQASALVSDSMRQCAPHCTFDGYDQGLQNVGQRDAMLSDIGIGIGIASAAVAGYFWYRELTGHTHAEAKGDAGVVVVPSVGQNFHGAAAAVRF
jgi:hypothetical protein